MTWTIGSSIYCHESSPCVLLSYCAAFTTLHVHDNTLFSETYIQTGFIIFLVLHLKFVLLRAFISVLEHLV